MKRTMPYWIRIARLAESSCAETRAPPPVIVVRARAARRWRLGACCGGMLVLGAWFAVGAGGEHGTALRAVVEVPLRLSEQREARVGAVTPAPTTEASAPPTPGRANALDPTLVDQEPVTRTFWLTWTYPPGSDIMHAKAIIYRSLEGGPWEELTQSKEAAQSLAIVIEEQLLGKKHCYKIVTVVGSNVARQSRPYCRVLLPVPQAEGVKLDDE